MLDLFLSIYAVFFLFLSVIFFITIMVKEFYLKDYKSSIKDLIIFAFNLPLILIVLRYLYM